jgi:hypothetical protein
MNTIQNIELQKRMRELEEDQHLQEARWVNDSQNPDYLALEVMYEGRAYYPIMISKNFKDMPTYVQDMVSKVSGAE